MSAHPHESEQVIDFMMAPPSPKDLQHHESGRNKRSPLNGFTGLVRKVNGAIFRSKGDADEDQYLDHDFHLGLGSSTEQHAMNFDELYNGEDKAYDLNRYSVNTQNSELSHEMVTRHGPSLKISGPTETGDIPELNNYTIAEEDEDNEEARITTFSNGNELMSPPTRMRHYASKETIASVYRIIESYQKEENPNQQDGTCTVLPPPTETTSIHSGSASGSNPIPEMASLELHELSGRGSNGSLPPKPSRATQLLTSLSHLQNPMGNQPPSPTTYGSQASLGRRQSSKSTQSQKHSIVNMQRSPTVESGSGYSTFVDVFCDYRDTWLGEEEEGEYHLYLYINVVY
jgi:hypothetical protein